MTSQNTSKDCPYCGKSLPLAAIFCYYCQRELVARPERPDAETKHNGLSQAFLVVIVIVVVVGYLIVTSG